MPDHDDKPMKAVWYSRCFYAEPFCRRHLSWRLDGAEQARKK